MTVIVIDTNIIAAHPRLGGAALTSLIEHAEAWGVRIVVPEVVVMEAVTVVRRLWKVDRDRLAGLRLGQFGLSEDQAAMVAAVDCASEQYEEWLPARLDELGVEVWPVPDVGHMEIARRASAGRTPFTRKDGKTKDGYRDTLIWLTVVEVAKGNVGEEIWLVSDNHTDFGPKSNNSAGPGSGKRDDRPMQFHHELVGELEALGLAERVQYVVSIDVLEQHLASQFAPIDAADLEQLVGTIDISTLAGQLMILTLGQRLDPASAALPAGVAWGEIVGVREQRQGWKFTDAARRGAEGWTARFAVDTEIDIEIVGAPWLGSEQSKVLSVTGRIYVSSTGEVVKMAVDSIEATPGDQERARRARRHDADSMEEVFRRIGGMDTAVSKIAAQLREASGTDTAVSKIAAQLREASGTDTAVSKIAAQLREASGTDTAVSKIAAQLREASGMDTAVSKIAAQLREASGMDTAVSKIAAQLREASGTDTAVSKIAAQLREASGMDTAVSKIAAQLREASGMDTAVSKIAAQLREIGGTDSTRALMGQLGRTTQRNDGRLIPGKHPAIDPEGDPPSDTAPAAKDED